MTRPPLVVSVGCPSGIGPEVAVEACSRLDEPVILVGDRAQLEQIARQRGLSIERHAIVQPGPALAERSRRPGHPTRPGGAAQLAWVEAALDLVRRGEGRALVTGPVNKKIIADSGAPGSRGFAGHTEYLQQRLGAAEVVMAFWAPTFSTSLVTTHLPLRSVARRITPGGVERAAFWLAWLLEALAPGRTPRVGVAGVNPHAGEGGLLGSEELDTIGPGIALARRRAARAGVAADFSGPLGAETAFRVASAGGLDGVVAMYHDQATIPMKLLGFGDAVNVSLGLPVVRTSVDHGTGYEIAGTGKADFRGMSQALALAQRLTLSPGATALSERAPPRGRSAGKKRQKSPA